MDLLDLKGAIVTTEAANTFRLIAAKILERGSNFVFAVKGNQANFENELRDLKESIDEGLTYSEMIQEGSIH